MKQDWDLRALTSNDLAAIVRHWHALPAGQRYMRFGHLYPDTALDRIAQALDFTTDVFCGLYSPQGELAAMVQAAPDEAGAWELAFSVLPRWQRNHFAQTLGERIFRMLSARGARLVRVRCLHSNEAMRQLAQALGFDLHEEAGELLGERVTGRPGLRRSYSVDRAG